MSESQDWIDRTIAWLQSEPRQDFGPGLANVESKNDAESRGFQPPAELHWPIELLEALPNFIAEYFDQSRPIETLATKVDHVLANLTLWLQQYLHRLRTNTKPAAEDFETEVERVARGLARMYQTLQPFDNFSSESNLLQTLLAIPSQQSVNLWVDLMVKFPPNSFRSAAASVQTLTRRPGWDVDDVFPSLLPGLDHPSTIASVLDLANWCVHERRIDVHPAESMADRLLVLLRAVVDRLSELETNPTAFGSDVSTIGRIIDESVAVCVALCDAMGLMRFEPALSALHDAADLRHRRIACEAAAALMQLDDRRGREDLVQLVTEPVARLRVLKYADELGILDQLPEEFIGEPAIAESKLALWLASYEGYGIAPKRLEMIDDRMLMWPSFEEPQACYLFRFDYPFADGQISNVGIAGPLVHAFAADMAELPVMDIYAAFAGWQAEHPEIYDVPPDQFSNANTKTVGELRSELEELAYSDVETLWLGKFFDDWALVAAATYESAHGVIVYDGSEKLWYPQSGRSRPIGPNEAYYIYKGRRFLRSFNL